MAEQRAGEPKLPTLAESEHWVGLEVDGIGGRTLGRVAALHVDAADGEPRWVVLRLGPVAGCTAIPFEHVAEGAGRLWAAYDAGVGPRCPALSPEGRAQRRG